jgi:bacterioferritin
LLIAHITVLRCKRQYRLALRHHSPPLAADALEHANEAKLQGDRITERILQLGGKPDKSPDALPHHTRTEQEEKIRSCAVIAELRLAARAAVESYHEFAGFFAPFDPITTILDRGRCRRRAGARQRARALAEPAFEPAGACRSMV